MHGCGELPAAGPRWEPHSGGNTSWAPAASPEPSAAVSHPCTELCAASSREQPHLGLPPPPPALPPLTTVSRCPADGFHGILFIHYLGEPEVTLEGQRGEQRCLQGEGLLTPTPATTPRPPGKPTDFKGSIGGQVCVEQVLWLQVTVDDSIFVQILQREKAGMGGRKGRGRGSPICLGQNLGGGSSDLGPSTNMDQIAQLVLWKHPTPVVPEPPARL